jgi:hypothetical protein
MNGGSGEVVIAIVSKEAAPGVHPDKARPQATLGQARVANETLHPHIVAMQDTERSSESVLERKERLEMSISEALQREAARHEAVVKNMHRLRALRLERDQKAKCK